MFIQRNSQNERPFERRAVITVHHAGRWTTHRLRVRRVGRCCALEGDGWVATMGHLQPKRLCFSSSTVSAQTTGARRAERKSIRLAGLPDEGSAAAALASAAVLPPLNDGSGAPTGRGRRASLRAERSGSVLRE